MCEFSLPSCCCAVTGELCRQLGGMSYLSCAAREIGFQVYDYSAFFDYVSQKPYPKPPPPEYDFDRDTYMPAPF